MQETASADTFCSSRALGRACGLRFEVCTKIDHLAAGSLPNQLDEVLSAILARRRHDTDGDIVGELKS